MGESGCDSRRSDHGVTQRGRRFGRRGKRKRSSDTRVSVALSKKNGLRRWRQDLTRHDGEVMALPERLGGGKRCWKGHIGNPVYRLSAC
ncbi:hypothetical protein E2542_SST23828 [Spatholobus suberectus]|nr:hypothetical protein E2542_SST23828 [Spatholobus suberectus]